MNDTHNAAATALETSSGPEVENKIAVRVDWSPEAFKQQVEQEKQMRTVMHDYMASAMKKDHHYYSFKEGDKPAITQEGAHAICSLMKCTIGRPEITETYHPGTDHLSVRVRVSVYNQNGDEVATGDGICSTRESKYAYRWVWDNELPKTFDGSSLKSKSGVKKNGAPWTQYQMPNQDLPDLYNTVLKMAVKRAKVAAVRQLPLVSELFVAEAEEDESDAPRTTQNARSAEKFPTSLKDLDKQQTESAVEAVQQLALKALNQFDVSLESIEKAFPAGKSGFEEMTDEEALEIKPKIAALINAKIAEQKEK